MTEHQEQTALFRILAMYEDKYPLLKWIHAIPNGGHRHISVAKRMKDSGVKSGVWDIFVPIPVDGYSGMYIEMKWGKNKLTDNQEAFRYDLLTVYRWSVCYSAIEAAHTIGDYLEIYELMEVE